MNNLNWDDIRFVLAVAKSGSTNAAAKELGVTHATVLRRIAGFEQTLGRRLFEKSHRGYRLLDDAKPVLNAAEGIEAGVFKLERTITGTDISLKGRVRIASTDTLSQVLLPNAFKSFLQEHPKIELSFLSGNDHHDLTRLSADIIVRPALQLSDELIGEQVGELAFGVYARPECEDKWLAMQGPLRRSLPANWLADHSHECELGAGSDSFLTLAALARQGYGRTFLPRIIAQMHPDLIELEHQAPRFSVPVWVASLEEIANTPRFVAVRKALVSYLNEALAPDD